MKKLFGLMLVLSVVFTGTVFASGDFHGKRERDAGIKAISDQAERVVVEEIETHHDPMIYAIQLYADWCTSCEVINQTYGKIQQIFNRKNLEYIVFDRTDEEAENKSIALAKDLGLEDIYHQNEGTGKVLLYDSDKGEIVGTITKEDDFDKMSMKIEEALVGKDMVGSDDLEAEPEGGHNAEDSSEEGSSNGDGY